MHYCGAFLSGIVKVAAKTGPDCAGFVNHSSALGLPRFFACMYLN